MATVKKPTVKRNLTAYNKQKRTKPMNKDGYIVIHWVGAVSSAKNNAQYFAGGDRQASAHYFVDDNEIWQSVLTKNYASWHCGGGLQSNAGHKWYGICKNDNSIGIEMCCARGKDGKMYITDKTIARTGKLVKWLMSYYGIPASHVIRHFDVTGKDCPHGYTTDKDWKKLKEALTK